ncbi:MAG: hypothetical protein ACIAQU_08905, partial [Phycisphaerales bacterium JB064]
HAHATYRRRLEWGAALVTVSMALYIATRAGPYLSLGPLGGALVDMPIADHPGAGPPPDVSGHTLRGVLLLLALAGWWLLTTPRDPPAIRRVSRTRAVVRWLGVVLAFMVVVDRLGVLAIGRGITIGLEGTLGWLALLRLLWVAHVPLAMLHVRNLAARAGSRGAELLAILAIVAMLPWFVPCLLVIIFWTTLAPLVVQSGATLATASLYLALRRTNRRAPRTDALGQTEPA